MSTRPLRELPDRAEPPHGAAPLTWEGLYAAHAARVAGWAVRLGGPGLDGEDLVHEVFLQVQKLLPRYDGTCKVTTWLYGITVNVVRTHRRSARRRFLRHLFGGREQARSKHVRTPLEEVESRQLTEIVYRLLDSLRENHRTALILFELEGLSGEAIAELTGASPQTVWVWLHRARAQFREALERQHPELVPWFATLSRGESG